MLTSSRIFREHGKKVLGAVRDHWDIKDKRVHSIEAIIPSNIGQTSISNVHKQEGKGNQCVGARVRSDVSVCIR